MPTRTRNLIACILLLALMAGITKAVLLNQSLPPADYTFVNQTEIKSLDPAIVTGHPENRIINAVFEGLTRLHPETLKPIPGLAKSWDVEDDLLTYTFHMREEARWTDGSPVTAHDIHYSLRRFLGPRTAAEYSYQAWYIKNARNYSLGAKGIEVGDAVEVELNLPVDAINTLRGELLRGKLLAVKGDGEETKREFVVEIDGRPVRFRATDDETAATKQPAENVRWCRQVLLDFREVGIEVLDPLTIRFTLENPTPFFLDLMGFYPLFPVNKKCVETHGYPQWAKPENIVSNGPFYVEFRRIRDRIRMRKNESYWGRDRIRLNIVDALSVDAITTALNLFMTGKADRIVEAPGPALRILRNQQPPRNDLNPAPQLTTYFYILNTKRKPLDDIRVRRALAMALNREEITTKLLAAGELPALGLVPPGITGYESQKTPFVNDPAEARRLLAEAGYPEGKGFPRLDIHYNTHEMHQTIAELIRKQWQRELGISISTRNEEWSTYLASQRQMQYNISRRAWTGDYADPNTFLDMFITDSEQNSTGWSNEEYDRLIAAASTEIDPAARMELFEKAESILVDELPIIPIYFYSSKNMVKPYVRGFYNNVQDHHPVWAIWIDRESGETNEFMRKKGQP